MGARRTKTAPLRTSFPVVRYFVRTVFFFCNSAPSMKTGSTLLPAALLLILASLALAHDHGDEHGDMNMDMHTDKAHSHPLPSHNTSISTNAGADASNAYYFALAPHRGWLYLHILTMLLSWVIIMPVATTLSLASSRHHVPAQISFLTTNVAGIVFAAVHAGLTEDLYPAASHRKLGWALLVILGVQAAVGMLARVVRNSGHEHGGGGGFRAVPAYEDEAYSRLYSDRRSADSGHGGSVDQESSGYGDEDHGLEWVGEKSARGRWWVDLATLENALSASVPGIFNERVVKICNLVYSVIARFLIPLGFTQICLGIVTGAGIFMGSSVLNGLAHFIKGGVFFLYGILTLSRWLGAFSELGWSWNLKPTTSRAFTCETVESGGIFLYGCANVFLEHLASWGGAWSHGDLQHVSIAFMFLGGGLLGLLLESTWIWLVLGGQDHSDHPAHNAGFTPNPLPALVIFLLGTLMSQHHQHSHFSSTIHTQWGALLAAAAVCRSLTYLLFFRVPPRSTQPTRPPTEVLTAFCLIAGGVVFMCSNRDTVNYLERIGVDAMFSLTLTVGVTALCMCWVTVVVAVGAWAGGRKAEVERV
ncbi:integral membrane protein-like protein [Tricharina praecox]|uniref:integral membrane protein-like protein n=1 Tax=Tricharina praecox TaxID=43433 RepID=UPI00221F0C1A|nr:integral membrane protein-like protein [Tricharina praecox]KAI5855440.1 integral membrane protein-like protein [Tricharina praecox]